jgi:hypothetical protein
VPFLYRGPCPDESHFYITDSLAFKKDLLDWKCEGIKQKLCTDTVSTPKILLSLPIMFPYRVPSAECWSKAVHKEIGGTTRVE